MNHRSGSDGGPGKGKGGGIGPGGTRRPLNKQRDARWPCGAARIRHAPTIAHRAATEGRSRALPQDRFGIRPPRHPPRPQTSMSKPWTAPSHCAKTWRPPSTWTRTSRWRAASAHAVFATMGKGRQARESAVLGCQRGARHPKGAAPRPHAALVAEGRGREGLPLVCEHAAECPRDAMAAGAAAFLCAGHARPARLRRPSRLPSTPVPAARTSGTRMGRRRAVSRIPRPGVGGCGRMRHRRRHARSRPRTRARQRQCRPRPLRMWRPRGARSGT